MTTIKLLLDNNFTRKRKAVFPALSRAEVTARQKFVTLFLAFKPPLRRSAWYTLPMATNWDHFFYFYRAPSAILSIVALFIASALMFRA